MRQRQRVTLIGAAGVLSLMMWVAPAWAQEEPAPQQEAAAPATEPQDATPAEAQTATEAETVASIPLPAEPAAAVPEPAPQAESPNRIDEVMVTATKREKSARDIPASINAYSGDDLDRRGATNLEEMVKLQPGTSKNGNRVVMRGVATSSLGSYTTSEEVGRFLNDVSLNAPSTRGALADLDTFDMQSIEIAKGPQGTLFGGTALSGAVRYIPNKPDLGAAGGALRFGIGSVAHSDELQNEANLMLNLPLTENFGLRAAGSWRRRPGAIDDLHSGENDIDGRTQKQERVLALWEVTPALTLDAVYLKWTEDQDDLGFTSSPDRYETSIRRLDQPSSMEARLMSFRGQYRWDAASLVGIVSRLDTSWYDVVDLSGALGVQAVPLVKLPLPVAVSAQVPTYELRLVSNAPSESDWWLLRDWDYLAGLFLMKADQYGNSSIVAGVDLPDLPGLPLPAAYVSLDAVGRSSIEERAFFFDLTRNLFERKLELSIGGRMAEAISEGNGSTSLYGVPVRRLAGESKVSRYNPKFSATWRYTRDHSLYAAASQGFRYGGANGNPTAGIEPGVPQTFDSDSLWNYEIGLRNEWFDKTLRLDVTGFFIDWKNLQIQQISVSQQNYVDNVGGAEIRGVESMLRWSPPEEWPLLPAGLTLSLGASYIDARITADFDSSDGPVKAHTRLPLTPYIQASGGISWIGSIGSWLLAAGLTDAYYGDRYNQLADAILLPAYHSVGATLTLSNPTMRSMPQINLSGTNILDAPAQNFGFAATVGQNNLYVLNRPRTLLLSLQVNF